jgi:tRNA(Ile)-lysidine synthase
MPYGMCGTKLVSDYLTDKKYNLFQRRRQKVLVDASGEIVWLLKERVSQKVAVTDNTINVLTVRYVNDEE